jgi:hypothetical protein
VHCLYYIALFVWKNALKIDSSTGAAGLACQRAGPELWAQTGGHITHCVASMGTTGTVMGVSAYLKAMARGACMICLRVHSEVTQGYYQRS